MKIRQLLVAFTVVSFAIGFNSCKKNDAASGDDLETTFELSGDQAIADNLTQDANDVFLEIAVDNNISGNLVQPAETPGIISCATVTITPLQGFPKTIVIDFGTSCTHNGITRSGKINILLTDSVRRPGSTATMTFTNYFVNLYKVEGTIIWTNTSTAGTRSWRREVQGGKITAPNGNYWLHVGTVDVAQTAGVGTYTILDDEFSMTGSHRVTNAAGRYRDCIILEALKKKTACANIDKGKLKVQGQNHFAVIDFGDGTCDQLATISIDGNPPRTIILR